MYMKEVLSVKDYSRKIMFIQTISMI